MSNKNKTIVQEHQNNFDTLTRAFDQSDVVLMDCINAKTGEHEALICAVNFDGEEYQFTPFARMINGNPFDMFIPPNENGEYNEIDTVNSK